MLYNQLVQDVLDYTKLPLDEIKKRYEELDKIDKAIPNNPSQEYLNSYYSNSPFYYSLFREDPYHYSCFKDYNAIKFLTFMKAQNVLDFGCGLGTTSIRIAQNGMNVTAVDFDGPNLDFVKWRAQRHTNNMSVITLDDFKYEQKYDGIVCFEVFEHLYNPTEILTKLHKMLTPKGVLLLTVEFPPENFPNLEPAHVTPQEEIKKFFAYIQDHFTLITTIAAPGGTKFNIDPYPIILVQKEYLQPKPQNI
jgi:2-polyprenyl-3-methyl-5-hydroxy-6-metoxy-1,4-benzoquinol methylase